MASDLSALHRKLITANHILHYHDVVDAYGHISVRHPNKPDVYIMCGYMAPGVVSSPADLIEYYVEDGATVDPKAKKGYSERFIHGEILKRFPDVKCVVHSHAEAVLNYVTSGVPLMPFFHMAGFLGELLCPTTGENEDGAGARITQAAGSSQSFDVRSWQGILFRYLTSLRCTGQKINTTCLSTTFALGRLWQPNSPMKDVEGRRMVLRLIITSSSCVGTASPHTVSISRLRCIAPSIQRSTPACRPQRHRSGICFLKFPV